MQLRVFAMWKNYGTINLTRKDHCTWSQGYYAIRPSVGRVRDILDLEVCTSQSQAFIS